MHKKTFYKALFLGVFIYLATLIYQLPASLLKPVFNERMPITASYFTGSVWQGSVGTISVKVNDGLINIGQLQWQLKPICFFSLKLCADLQLSPNNNSLGDIYLDSAARMNFLNKTVLLQNSDADIDATWLLEMVAVPISAKGRITLKSETIELQANDNLPTIFGQLRWQKAGVDYPEEYDLGNYIIDIETRTENNDKTINGLLSDENGLISSNGSINFTQNGEIDINIKLRKNRDTPDSLASILELIGKPDNQGAYSVKHKTFLKTIL